MGKPSYSIRYSIYYFFLYSNLVTALLYRQLLGDANPDEAKPFVLESGTEAPSDHYSRSVSTCEGFVLESAVLSASCFRVDGVRTSARVDMNKCLENQNGHLIYARE